MVLTRVSITSTIFVTISHSQMGFLCAKLFSMTGVWMTHNGLPFPGALPGGLKFGSVFRFQSSNYPGRMFRHRDWQVWLDPKSNASLYVMDSSFRIVDGLTGKGKGT